MGKDDDPEKMSLFPKLDYDLDNSEKIFNRAMNTAAIGLFKLKSVVVNKTHSARYDEAQLHLAVFAPNFVLTRPSHSRRAARPERMEDDAAICPKREVANMEMALNTVIAETEKVVHQKAASLSSRVRPILSNSPPYTLRTFELQS